MCKWMLMNTLYLVAAAQSSSSMLYWAPTFNIDIDITLLLKQERQAPTTIIAIGTALLNKNPQQPPASTIDIFTT